MPKTLTNPTPDLVKQQISAVLDADWLSYLYGRWRDESEYEDINEYGKAFAKNTGYTVLKSTKRPFGFQFSVPEVPGAIYEMQVTAKAALWRRLK